MNKVIRYKAISIHLFTALGAILAILALEAASRHSWEVMILWLVLAFVVDGIDGPLARKFDVKTNAPEWDGVLLDLIIDYLTYVFIPAFALWQSNLLPNFWGGVAAGLICFSSVMYFSDTRMKTKDNSFSGFPGCWNMVIIVLFALHPNPVTTLLVILFLMIAMFFPLKFVHPVRTDQFRPITLAIALIWTASAAYSAWHGFEATPQINVVLFVTSLYLLFIGMIQQWLAKS